MKKTNLDLEDQLSKDIGKIAKDNGMTKQEWCVSALTLVRDKYLAKKAAASYPPTETINTATNSAHSFTEGSDIAPLDENGQPSIPEYKTLAKSQEPKLFTFFMNDGGEIKQSATSLQEAMDILQIGENEYLDYMQS